MKRRQKKFKDFETYLLDEKKQTKKIIIEKEEKDIIVEPKDKDKSKHLNKNAKRKYNNNHQKFIEDDSMNNFLKFKIVDENEIFDFSDSETQSSDKKENSSNKNLEKIHYNLNLNLPNAPKVKQNKKILFDQIAIGNYIEIILKYFNGLTRQNLFNRIIINNFNIEATLLKLYNEIYSEKPSNNINIVKSNTNGSKAKKGLDEMNKKNDLNLLNQMFPTMDENLIEKIYINNNRELLSTKNFILNIDNKMSPLIDFNINNINNLFDKDKINKIEGENKIKNKYIDTADINYDIENFSLCNFYNNAHKAKAINLNEYFNIKLNLIKQSIISYMKKNTKEAKGILNNAKKIKVCIEELHDLYPFIYNDKKYSDDDEILDINKLSYNEILLIIQAKKNQLVKERNLKEEKKEDEENSNSNELRLLITYNYSHLDLVNDENILFYPDFILSLRTEMNIFCKGYEEDGYIIVL